MSNIRIEKMFYEFPKTELHLHIEGTFEPELMFEIAQRNRTKLPYKTVEDVKRAYRFTDLQSFLDIYYNAMSVLLHERDFYELTMAYLKKASSQGVRHAEIFFDPQAHTNREVPFETIVNGISRALDDGQKNLGISSKLVMCFLRDLTPVSAMETLDNALSFKDRIFAVGLDSKELGNPPKKFQDVFKKARERGFVAVAHAGEEAPAEYVWQALDLLGVSRVDHGYHSLEDPKLIDRLVREQIPMTACPLASVGVSYFESMDKFPIKKMLNLGLLVMLNSDDPAYFGGYVAENYKEVTAAVGLTEEDVLKLLKNSFKASFLSENTKQRYLTEIDMKMKQLI
ncbi:MAG TPA: adenosine deaminase [Candidatus Acidoferrales bacterium]|nr:adenosine deaminase [Candidatus Acidoferrales bacterium]